MKLASAIARAMIEVIEFEIKFQTLWIALSGCGCFKNEKQKRGLIAIVLATTKPVGVAV